MAFRTKTKKRSKVVDSSLKLISIAFTMLKKAISKISDEEVKDIYALSFFIYDIDDDPRTPELTLGYNTLTNYEESKSKSKPTASDNEEAKWNYAFWLQNYLCVIGEHGTESGNALESWIGDIGLAYTDEEEDDDFDNCMILGREITTRFVQLVVDLAKLLHANGIIEKKFKRPIPIIVHELEYYDQIVTQTREANPPGLAEEFAQWVEGM